MNRFALLGFTFAFLLIAGCTSTQTSNTQPSQVPAASNTAASTVPGQMATYANAQYGFQMDYPAGWTVKENSTLAGGYSTVVMFEGPRIDNLYTPSIMVHTENAGGYTENHFAQNEKQQMTAKYGSGSVLDEGTIKVGGLDAYYLHFRLGLQGNPEQKGVYLVKDDRYYFISYATLESDYNTSIKYFDASIASFKFTS